MATVEEQIQEIEDEIQKTPYNKATQHHIGKLKAKLARMRDDVERRRQASGGGPRGYAVKKSGNATIGLVGFPSVGKSTLLNKITDAESEVGDYHFTTLDVIPGALNYRGAKIQILDLPGLIKDASKGKGRGREVLSVVRSLDLVVLMIDVFETNVNVMVHELEQVWLRLNQKPADIVITKNDRGGVGVHTTVKLTKMDEVLVEDILREYGHINADIVIREDITEEQLLDFLAGNRIYTPAIIALNKIDLVNEEYIRTIEKRFGEYKIVPISAEKEIGLEDLKEAVFQALDFICIYMKPQGKEADMEEPLVIKKGSTVEMVCNTIHRDFARRFRYANVWGKSAKFPGQTVGLQHVVSDQDIVTIVIRR